MAINSAKSKIWNGIHDAIRSPGQCLKNAEYIKGIIVTLNRRSVFRKNLKRFVKGKFVHLPQLYIRKNINYDF